MSLFSVKVFKGGKDDRFLENPINDVKSDKEGK
jgi:hypothetical protein